MKLRYIFSALCVVFAAMLMACGGGSKNPNKSHLEDAIDSVSYIVGMNVGYNILKMDMCFIEVRHEPDTNLVRL